MSSRPKASIRLYEFTIVMGSLVDDSNIILNVVFLLLMKGFHNEKKPWCYRKFTTRFLKD